MSIENVRAYLKEMNCPKCKSNQVYVIDSRHKEDTIHRRRECQECGHRYNTVEVEANEHKSLKEKAKMLRWMMSKLDD